MAPHVLQVNGFSRRIFELPVDPDQSLRARFERMDGARLFAFTMWPIAPGEDLETSHGEFGYIQCAGRADRLTVELREVVGAETNHVVLGVPTRSVGARDVEIAWADSATFVSPHERYDAAGAAALFMEFYETGTVGASAMRRAIPL